MGVITTQADFEHDQIDKRYTLPNVLSAGRGVGGVVLGVSMSMNSNLDWRVVVGGAVIGGLSDAEGSMIKLAKNWPEKVREGYKFRVGDRELSTPPIKPSTYGVRWDVYGDKTFALSMLAGGNIGGYLPWPSLTILGPEVLTAVVSLYTGRKMGKEPEVSIEGKIGMIARIAEISTYLSAWALHKVAPGVSEALTNVGYGLTGTAVVLGSMSCFNVFKQGKGLPEITSPAIDIMQNSYMQPEHPVESLAPAISIINQSNFRNPQTVAV